MKYEYIELNIERALRFISAISNIDDLFIIEK